MKVAVIGAGAAGREFAAACAGAGLSVVLEDVMPEKLRRAGDAFSSLGVAVLLVPTVEDAVRDADVVMDFVPDDLESKLEIWSMIDRMAPPRTVMCTPSELLSITDLASCTYRPDRCVMVRGELVGSGELRVISAAASSAEACGLVAELFTTIGYRVSFQDDPDLPMLLKNMNAAAL